MTLPTCHVTPSTHKHCFTLMPHRSQAKDKSRTHHSSLDGNITARHATGLTHKSRLSQVSATLQPHTALTPVRDSSRGVCVSMESESDSDSTKSTSTSLGSSVTDGRAETILAASRDERGTFIGHHGGRSFCNYKRLLRILTRFLHAASQARIKRQRSLLLSPTTPANFSHLAPNCFGPEFGPEFAKSNSDRNRNRIPTSAWSTDGQQGQHGQHGQHD